LFSLIPTIHSLLVLLILSWVRTLLLFLVFLSVAFSRSLLLLVLAVLPTFILLHLQGKFLLKVLYKLRLEDVPGGVRIILCKAHSSCVVGGLEKFRASFSENLKSADFRLIMVNLWRHDHSAWEMLQKDVRQIRPKEASIQIDVPTAACKVSIRHVGLLTTRTINLHPTCPLLVSHAQRKHLLPVTVKSRASTVGTIQILLVNFR